MNHKLNKQKNTPKSWSKKNIKQDSETQSNSFTPENGKIDAQKFFNFIMMAARDMMNDELITIKRELEDCKYLIKSLRNRQIDIEDEYKSLGISLGQLGIAEINLLNATKNSIKDKISVVMSNGQVKGRTDITRYNLYPDTETMKIRLQ